jgi:TLD
MRTHLCAILGVCWDFFERGGAETRDAEVELAAGSVLTRRDADGEDDLVAAFMSQFPGLGALFSQVAFASLVRDSESEKEEESASTAAAGPMTGSAWLAALVAGCFEPTHLFSSRRDGCTLSRLLDKCAGYRAQLAILVSLRNICSMDSADEPPSECTVGILLPADVKSSTKFQAPGAALLALCPSFARYGPASGEPGVFAFARGGHAATHLDKHVAEGFGVGGTTDKFRFFVDAEFTAGTASHWYSDKQYDAGPILGSNQSFSPYTFDVAEVELWGMGGVSALSQQVTHQHRQLQLTEQRRTVDRARLADEWRSGGGDRALMDMVSTGPPVQENAADIRREKEKE